MKKHEHAELLRAIADGKQMQVQDGHGSWHNCCGTTALRTITEGLFRRTNLRVKPTTITVNGIEVPEPLRDFSTIRDYYWAVSPFKGACMITYCADLADQHALKSGLCHATKEAAQAHFEAIISTSKLKEGTQ